MQQAEQAKARKLATVPNQEFPDRAWADRFVFTEIEDHQMTLGDFTKNEENYFLRCTADIRAHMMMELWLYKGSPVLGDNTTMAISKEEKEDGTRVFWMYGAHKDHEVYGWTSMAVNAAMEICEVNRDSFDIREFSRGGMVDLPREMEGYWPKMFLEGKVERLPVDPSGLLGEWFVPFIHRTY
jgi:hypothetical protein